MAMLIFGLVLMAACGIVYPLVCVALWLVSGRPTTLRDWMGRA